MATNIHIINTYAPQLGSNKGERTKYWKDVKTIYKILIRMIVLYGVPIIMGKLALAMVKMKKLIGNWSYGNKTEIGHVGIKKEITNYNLDATNTIQP